MQTIDGITTCSVGTSAAWAITNEVIPQGVLCIESDTRYAKFGDGVHLYKDLEYFVSGSGLSDELRQRIDDAVVNGDAASQFYYAIEDLGTKTGAVSFNVSTARFKRVKLTGSSSLSFTNRPAAGLAWEVAVEFVNPGTASSIAWAVDRWSVGGGAD